jgi:hypothetical protein
MPIPLRKETQTAFEEVYSAFRYHSGEFIFYVARVNSNDVWRVIVRVGGFAPRLHVDTIHVVRAHLFTFEEVLDVVKIKSIRCVELVEKRKLNDGLI